MAVPRDPKHALQSRLVSLEASVKPLQRDILLSQKQRAFSKAVVLVAPEKRLLVVVLTAAVFRVDFLAWRQQNERKKNTNNQASSTCLESLERCELQITSPRKRATSPSNQKKRHQIEATTASRGASVFGHPQFHCGANQIFW